jgi:hypothetical protein
MPFHRGAIPRHPPVADGQLYHAAKPARTAAHGTNLVTRFVMRMTHRAINGACHGLQRGRHGTGNK